MAAFLSGFFPASVLWSTEPQRLPEIPIHGLLVFSCKSTRQVGSAYMAMQCPRGFRLHNERNGPNRMHCAGQRVGANVDVTRRGGEGTQREKERGQVSGRERPSARQKINGPCYSTLMVEWTKLVNAPATPHYLRHEKLHQMAPSGRGRWGFSLLGSLKQTEAAYMATR